MRPFAEWESFYVIVGSSAAALTGLQFVVMALVADLRSRSTIREINAFATPTIIHFGAVLLLSGILSAPWHRIGIAAVLLGVFGLTGLGYSMNVVRRARRQSSYRMVLEDWIFHAALPTLAYAALFIATCVLPFHTHDALFVIAAAALILLFVGIHNAWDTVTYLVVGGGAQERDKARDQPSPGATTPGA
ncbi:MAG: hypothetical protein HOQ29_19760 [Acidobacteria bacterium]|nr:hypothetical protein [Acidobacteriota bacterium]